MSAREISYDAAEQAVPAGHEELPILVVEDNEDDVWLLEMALNRAGLKRKPFVVRDGAEAIDYLAGNGIFEDRVKHPFPYLVLLDSNLPRRNGLEVLEWWASETRASHPRIIVLTWSLLPSDINRAYQLGATSYLLKTGDNAQMADVIRRTLQFWSISQRPAVSDPDKPAEMPEQ